MPAIIFNDSFAGMAYSYRWVNIIDAALKIKK